MKNLLLSTSLVFTPIVGFAHHNVTNVYDPQRLIEVEGVVTETLWRNPHIQISLRVADENGEQEVWNNATEALSNLRRWKIDHGFIQPGDTVRLAGHPARQGNGIYITNVLTPAGIEVILDRSNFESRWSEDKITIAASRIAEIGNSNFPELGIFRVWSHPDSLPLLFPEDGVADFDFSQYPLTDFTKAAIAAYDRIRDNPIGNCQPKGMPTIMEAPYPHRFVQDGENILWHQEEQDTIRTIHMAPDASAEGKPLNRLGYSIGRWENDHTLVVTTTDATWKRYNTMGIPLTEEAVMEERFTVAEDGSRLDYSITVTDPTIFTEPHTATTYWLYYADAEVGRYDCLPDAEN